MANNRMTEGVGKKIVEALKMQSEVEVTPVEEPIEDTVEVVVEETSLPEEESLETEEIEEPAFNFVEEENLTNVDDFETIEETPVIEDNIMPAFKMPQNSFPSSDLDGFEIPANVAVLKQLITKLPAGVTKQTGATIIKQTMEALGISMRNVLQEAQQVQESLNNSTRECQASIVEYKKQIGVLEKQAQKYQRQYAALNDIISLFVQTNY